MTSPRGQLVVFTDLDATLLEEATYSFDAAREALDALRGDGVPLVLCSSKTAAEMERWACTLGVRGPLVIENGGAVLWPEGGGYRAQVRGVPRGELVAALAQIAHETGSALRGFSALTAEDVADLTGLSLDAAHAAMDREYDEPFLVDEGDAARVSAAASRRGLRVTRGGRLHHLTGQTDKGRAVREIMAFYRTDGRIASSVALGDSPNDASMLLAADRPIVIPRPHGAPDSELARTLPHAEMAPAPGPNGWNDAVLAVLRGGRLPTVGAAVGS